jgi:hypothetical protein
MAENRFRLCCCGLTHETHACVRNSSSNGRSEVNMRGKAHNLLEHNQKAVEHAKDCPRSDWLQWVQPPVNVECCTSLPATSTRLDHHQAIISPSYASHLPVISHSRSEWAIPQVTHDPWLNSQVAKVQETRTSTAVQPGKDIQCLR